MHNAITIVQSTVPTFRTGADNDERLIELWLHGRPKTTQLSYRGTVDRFLAHVSKSLHHTSLIDLQAFADSLKAAALEPGTQRKVLAGVKSLFSFSHRIGYLPFDTAKPLRLPPLRDTLAERVIDESSLHRMIDLEPNPRNATLLTLMYAAGLRASEIVSLRWRDCQARSGGQGQITVFGKGAKTRTVLLTANVFRRLMQLSTATSGDGYVFPSRKGNGPLNTSHLLRITKRAARRAGIERSVRNHDLRHSHASHSLQHGAPISLVSQTLGHTSIAATGRYLHARPGDSSGNYLPL